MAKEYNRARIGFFVIFGIVVLLGAIVWLGSQQVFSEFDRYYTYISGSVSGLDVSASVKFMGVAVGRVADITIDPTDSTRVEVILDLRPGTPVKQDMVAELRMTGITGIKYVELTGGDKDASRLAPSSKSRKSIIPSRATLLEKVDKQFEELYIELNAVIKNLRNLTDDDSQLDLTNTLKGISDLSSSLAETLTALKPTLAGVGGLEKQTEALLDTTKTEILMLGQSTRSGIDQLSSVIQKSNLDQTLNNFNHASVLLLSFAKELNVQLQAMNLERVSSDLRVTLVEIQKAAHDFEQLASELRRNPASLFFSKPMPERKPTRK